MYKGNFVILGGNSAAVSGLAEGLLIDLYQAPLDYRGRPMRVKWSKWPVSDIHAGVSRS